ncbi:MAG: thioredoxin family protein [Candidatus Heimdallarchaeaceae archaeon]|uniref:Thioredoxin n=1 Tax=Candidatus Heimdallarchaeum endolithica TaxID=2876572 RepID=A0A9Y1BTG5_9ARCH|nr:MAG: thioredoxin [Candidatus Heimdallarchaeum endolithica]
MVVEHVTKEEFDKILSSEKKKIIVDTWTPTCGPCKSISPYFETLSEQFGDKLRFLSINIEEESEIAQRYMITGVPTFIVFKDGKPHNSFVGATRKKLLKFIEEAINEEN